MSHDHPDSPERTGHSHDLTANTVVDAAVNTDHTHHTPHADHEHHAALAGHSEHNGHGGHNDHSQHDPAVFKRKFWLSLALTIPTLIFSTGLQDILGLGGPRFPGSQFIPAVFGIVLFFYGGMVFIRGGIAEVKSRRPGMMTLISLAIVVALGYSIAVTLGFPGMDFWWELATLITIMLLGHWVEMSAIMGAQNALGELAKLIPDEAERVEAGTTTRVPVAELSVGETVLVRPGGAIPVDGEVVDGASDVNESLLTGESTAVAATVGSAVIAGSINGSGALTVRVTRVGADTALAGVMKLVADAQASKSGTQVLADRAAALLFTVAVAAALITLTVWSLISPEDPAFVIERVVTVLVIACPHALGLAIPLVAQLSTAIGARRGVLMRSRAALEDARAIQVVLFDKTGTLTEGRQGVTDVFLASATTASKSELVALAAAVEASSEHPIARAIVAAGVATRRIPKSADGAAIARAEAAASIHAAPVTGFSSLAGRGAEATIFGRVITVGSARVVTERGLVLDEALVRGSELAASQGKTVVYVLTAREVLGAIAVADVIRPESAAAVADLAARGIRVAMLTGDSSEVASWVAAKLGISEVFSEVLPGEKAAVVERLQRDGTRVAMVGDGVNDAPALTQADVGIAIGAGTDVAIESAGIVLASSDPRAVADIITLSAATYRKMLQNLWWAAGYNIVALPLAAGVLAGAGILLSPAVGAILMSVSTIVVALNAQLLRRVDLTAAGARP